MYFIIQKIIIVVIIITHHHRPCRIESVPVCALCVSNKGWKIVRNVLRMLPAQGESAGIIIRAQMFVLNDSIHWWWKTKGKCNKHVLTLADCSASAGSVRHDLLGECLTATLQFSNTIFVSLVISNYRNAAKSTRKLSKENTKETTEKEKERPPWRTVITAAPQKVNKNALLKAKILDATRRALLAQKICHIGIQTEPTTTLVREQSIDVQKDLIRKMDKSMDTDGVITIRRECPQGCNAFHTL